MIAVEDLRSLALAAVDREALALAVLEDPDLDPEFRCVKAVHILRGEA